MPTTKLKDPNKKFSRWGRSAGMRTKGEVKRGGTQKRQKRDRKKEIAASAHPAVGLYSGTNLCASRRGQWIPTELIKPGNQTVVRCLWVSYPQVGLSPTWTLVCRICHFSPFPVGLFLLAEKITENTEMIVLLATTLYEVLLAEESLETPPSLVLSSWWGRRDESEVLPIVREFIDNKDRTERHLRREVGQAKECNGTKGRGCRVFKVKFFHYPGGLIDSLNWQLQIV